MSAGEWYPNGYNYILGGDYCACKRCPCCGKLEPARFLPYPNPYFVPFLPYIQPIEPFTIAVTTDPAYTVSPIDGSLIKLK